MSIVNRFVLLAVWLLAMAGSPLHAEVYKSVDKDGNVVYSDAPPTPDAQPMDMPALSIIPSPPAEPVVTMPGAGDMAADEGVTDIKTLRRSYRDFRLVSPTQDQTFTGTGNDAVVAWDARYQLQPGMTVVIYLDDQPQAPTTEQVVTLRQLDRGEHMVRADLVDARNRTIASAVPVRFHVWQNSVNFNRRQATPHGGG